MTENSPRTISELTAAELQEVFLRLRLYAECKVRAKEHRDATLDPHDLSMRAIVDTIGGVRRWNSERVPLYQHLKGAVDSYVSHRYKSPSYVAERSFDCDSDANGHADQIGVHGTDDSTPEGYVAATEEVNELRAFIQRRRPKLAALFDAVAFGDLALKDTEAVLRFLGLDASNSSHKQRAYRRVRALQDLTSQWIDESAVS